MNRREKVISSQTRKVMRWSVVIETCFLFLTILVFADFYSFVFEDIIHHNIILINPFKIKRKTIQEQGRVNYAMAKRYKLPLRRSILSRVYM